MKTPRKPAKVWHPPAYNPDVLRAIQAIALCAQGRLKKEDPEPEPPSPRDCKIALDWIINEAALTYDNGFVPNDPDGRIAAFVDGRQFVGQQIVKVMKLRPEILKQK